jgi:hypothetical protein
MARLMMAAPDTLTLLCVVLSTTMHFGWDAVAYTSQRGWVTRLLPMGLMLAMMLTWRIFCNIAQERSKQLFTSQQVVAS